MAWPWKYAARVLGLGDVSILFLQNARTDDEAKDAIRAGEQSDPRRQTVSLYRVSCIIDELTGKDFNPVEVVRGRVGRFMYIMTGADEQKKLHEDIFAAENVPSAMETARRRNWNNIRLYQCEEVPLS